MNAAERRARTEAQLADLGAEDALFADGYDAAILGIGSQGPARHLVVYDREAMLAVLMQGLFPLDRAEAEDHLAYNVEAAWVGDGTPLILDRLTDQG